MHSTLPAPSLVTSSDRSTVSHLDECASASRWDRLRWLPWSAASGLSIAAAFFAPHGRKPVHVDWSLTLEALQFSITKGPHIGAAMLLGLTAVIATSHRRLPLAFVLTLLVGAGWEIGQTTVIGHQARLSDLAPDAVGALLGCAWGAVVMWLLEAQRRSERSGPLPPRRRPHR